DAADGAAGSHPAAFVAVFLPMAVVALVGAWVGTRLQGPQVPEEAAAGDAAVPAADETGLVVTDVVTDVRMDVLSDTAPDGRAEG
ncbi:hypothetical protein GT044_08215, partial [Streptomyces sp. SID335]